MTSNILDYVLAGINILITGDYFLEYNRLIKKQHKIKENLYHIRKKYFMVSFFSNAILTVPLLNVIPNQHINTLIWMLSLGLLLYKTTKLQEEGHKIGGAHWLFSDSDDPWEDSHE